MEKLYADIIINISHEALDKVFAYKVPFSMIKDIRVGQQVVVPFGRSNKEKLHEKRENTLSYALRKCMDQRCLMNISVSIMWRKQDFLQLY